MKRTVRNAGIPGDDNVSFPQTVIPPAGSVTVDSRDPRPVLYAADGKPLARDTRIGYRP